MKPVTTLFHRHEKGGPTMVCKTVFALVIAGSRKFPSAERLPKFSFFDHSIVLRRLIELDAGINVALQKRSGASTLGPKASGNLLCPISAHVTRRVRVVD